MEVGRGAYCPAQRPHGETERGKCETEPIGELKHRPAKLLPFVEEYRERLEKLTVDEDGRLVLEKGDDAEDLRRALKAAAAALNRRLRFPVRGEDGSLRVYLEGQRGKWRRKAWALAGVVQAAEGLAGAAEEGRILAPPG